MELLTHTKSCRTCFLIVTLSHCIFSAFLLVNVQRGAVGEGYAVGAVEGLQVHLVIADASAYGNDGSQQFAMLTGIETRLLQLVPALQVALVAHLIGRGTEPCFQHVAYAVALALTAQQAPCALQ